MKLPKGTLLGQRAGSDETLRQMLGITASTDFVGYLRMTAKPGGAERAEGVLVFRGGACVLGYLSAPSQLFGQAVLDPFLRYATMESARLRLYRFDTDEAHRVEEYAGKHPTASVDLSSVPLANGGVTGTLDHMLKDLDRVSAVTEDLEGALETAREQQTELEADTARLSAAAGAIGELAAAEHRSVAAIAGARRSTQEQLRAQTAGGGDAALTAEVATLRAKVATLERSESDLKARERKLQDLERIFKRVLSSTEERLKAKEGEVVAREGALKEELETHQRRIAELEARAAALKSKDDSDGAAQSARASKKFDAERSALTSTISKLETEVRSLRAALESSPPPVPAGKAALFDESLTEDFKALLTALDQLMAHLPQDAVDRFATGPSFDLYERVMVAFELASASDDETSDNEEE